MNDEPTEVTLLLHCRNLPGTRFGEHNAVRLGIQKGVGAAGEVVEDVPAEAAREGLTFTVPLRVKRDPKTGAPDFGGPFVQGKPGERFVYLCWGERDREGGAWSGFRRAKLYLTPLPWVALHSAQDTGRPLEVFLDMTDADGGPVCATLRGDHVVWGG